MQLHSCATGAELIARAGEFLRTREVSHAPLLAVATREEKPPIDLRLQPFRATIEEAGRVVGVLVHMPPHQLLLSEIALDARSSAADCITAYLRAANVALPGVAGPLGVADVFAERWSRATGLPSRVHMALREFELSHVVPPAIVPGDLVAATPDDLDLVHAWMHAFIDETGLPQADRDFATRALAAERIETGRSWLWRTAGEVRVMAGSGGTERVARVGPVYTAPEHRGRGYGSAMAAALSQRLLDRGAWRVALSTDQANPTSNKIYQAIGYVPVGDSVMIAFVAPIRSSESAFLAAERAKGT